MRRGIVVLLLSLIVLSIAVGAYAKDDLSGIWTGTYSGVISLLGEEVKVEGERAELYLYANGDFKLYVSVGFFEQILDGTYTVSGKKLVVNMQGTTMSFAYGLSGAGNKRVLTLNIAEIKLGDIAVKNVKASVNYFGPATDVTTTPTPTPTVTPEPEPTPTPAPTPTIRVEKLIMLKGKTANPKNLTSLAGQWVTSDPLIVKINAKGLIKAVDFGEATLTFTVGAKPASGDTFKIDVEVVDKGAAVNKVTLSGKKKLFVGQTSQLKASLKPKTAKDTAVSWASNNKKIARVDQTGLVTAVAKGKTNIICVASSGVIGKAEITVK